MGGFKSPGVTKGSSTGFKGFGGTGFVNNESFPKNGFGSPNEVLHNNSVWDESADSASEFVSLYIIRNFDLFHLLPVNNCLMVFC